MSESRTALLRQTLETLLSQGGPPASSGTRVHQVGPDIPLHPWALYDMINFEGNKWNGVTEQHGFFVNVGVGSSEIDTVYPGTAVESTPVREYILNRNWVRLVPDVPGEAWFDESTYLDLFTYFLCDGLERVLAVIDTIDTTPTLAQWAIANNKLHRMEKICSYLAATGDIESITTYVTTLRDEFGNDPPWESFNRKLVDAVGPWSSALMEQGLLDSAVGPL